MAPRKKNMLLETQISKSVYLPVKPTSKIVMGNDVQEIPEDKLLAYAIKISGALAEHPLTMIQKNPGELLEAMKQGSTILYLETKTVKLLGFGRIWEYKKDEVGQQIYEFGSWLSFEKGAGKVVLAAARDLSSKLFPGKQLVALVEPENKKAQVVIEQFLDVSFEMGESHLLTKGPTLMKKYDLTKRISI